MFSRRLEWLLRGDIEQYFPSIDHAVLMGLVERKIKCSPTIELIRLILDRSSPQDAVPPVAAPAESLDRAPARRRGLPIWNLTSQFLANVYLNGLDHLIVETLVLGA